MVKIEKFKVIPYLPEKLKPLMTIANNMWWVWNFEAIELFRRLDVELWREVEQNPVKLLGTLPQKKLDEVAESESFIAHMRRVEEELERHINKKSWYNENSRDFETACVAYFSAEFGIHESLPIYSGGLGVLAGDHLKSASELGIPLVGVGMLYRLGYFHQYLTIDGWQQERFPETDFHNIPVTLMRDDKDQPLMISVEFPGRMVYAQIWKVNIGTVTLYLLDTNTDKNSAEDKTITDQLYGGDNEMRIKQELILGVGGVRALKAIGRQVTVYHMNEGHAAFLAVERIRMMMEEQGMSYPEALEFVTSNNVFTTHTPVPAGNDRFEPETIDHYCAHFFPKLGLTRDQFLALGRENAADKKETFCMTVLAIKTAAGCNGVAKLHGKVSRGMWKNIWPTLPVHEVPIGHVTNGIQTLSWTSDEMMRLFNRYLGPRWIDNTSDSSIWRYIDEIPDSELWRCRERLRERLVAFTRRRLREQLLERGVPPKEAEKANSVLDPEALTIGFARRFATYKRATLLFKNINRLADILNEKDRPVQLILSGKAHPRDNMGKELIKQIIHMGSDEGFRGKIIFLEDYDISIARYLVQGVDVWLNNPIRPKEASGTSGMKVVSNGGLNISILDGWWDEAYNANNGWAIGKGEEYSDLAYQDEVEALSLYNILENEVKPAFYERGVDGLPREWLGKIRESMRSLTPVFNTNRMVMDYTEKYYKQAHKNFVKFSSDGHSLAKNLSSWKKNVISKWDSVKILKTSFGNHSKDVTVGSKVTVAADISLGTLKPEEVLVELYFGALNQSGEIGEGVALPTKVKCSVSDPDSSVLQ
jgi:starch phosphorylase